MVNIGSLDTSLREIFHLRFGKHAFSCDVVVTSLSVRLIWPDHVIIHIGVNGVFLLLRV